MPLAKRSLIPACPANTVLIKLIAMWWFHFFLHPVTIAKRIGTGLETIVLF